MPPDAEDFWIDQMFLLVLIRPMISFLEFHSYAHLLFQLPNNLLRFLKYFEFPYEGHDFFDIFIKRAVLGDRRAYGSNELVDSLKHR
ncbi:MAG: hypothetical protein A2038_07655 [Deltaproteobacteria bacterium GWA2_57_13]|nr:MAG: hypothetical protein A2038_07655 [Deltaproteobacteria bacterium GWA2_57_13]